MAYQNVSQELLNLLNDAIAREIQVSIQYMWQHIQWTGVKAFAVKEEFKSISIDEMKHAEVIAERLFYLGGIPTTKPTPINVGSNLKEMLEQDVKDEENAIEMYKKIISLAEKEGDVTTAEIFRDILEDEEEHHDTFSSLLEDL
ncbi:MAG: ferritin-like domain-containing protein [bacterium]|nr:ferritin-like domain-containing protein [bacterium]